MLLLAAAGLRAQAPPAGIASRAQELWSKTKSTEEGAVACDELDQAAGNALLKAAGQARGASLERLTVAFRLAERAGRCTGSDDLLGAALNGLSDVFLGRGWFERALSVAEESVRIHEHLRGSGLAEAWNRVGNAHWWLNDERAALNDFQSALDLAAAAGDQPGEARAWNNIGNVHKSTGELGSALDAYTQALQIFESTGDRARAAVVINNIGIVYFLRGDYPAALEFGHRSLGVNRTIGNQSRVAATLDLLGNTYRGVGAYRAALRSFREALTIRTSIGNRPGVMETEHNIGLVHFSLGDYDLAIAAYRRALHLNREMGGHDANIVAEALRNIGAAAWRLGQRERAAANFREGLAIVQRNRVRVVEAELYHDLGQTSLAAGRFEEASVLFERALEIRRGIRDQGGITETLTAVASTRLAQHRNDAALDLARQAAANAAAHDQPELLWPAQTLAGIACRRLRQLPAAREALNAAIGSIEQLSRQVVGSENLRQQFFDNKLSPYHELIGLLVESHSFEEALDLAERSKARVLTQLLHGNHADDDAVLTADEKRERARRRDALYSLNRQIEQEREKRNGDALRVGALESARRAAREELAALEVSLASQHSELGARRGEVRPLTMADVDGIVRDGGTAVVEYVAADRQLFAFVVTTDGKHARVAVRRIPIGSAELAARVRRFRKRIAARDFAVAEDARTLYDVLLAPIRQYIDAVSHIVIVPDGVLWNVPFQALLSPKGYLIETAEVSYAPSITVLREILQRRGPVRPRALLAMGKAQFGTAPDPLLQPLPEAETQARLLGEIYGPQRSATYLGSEATESRFKAQAPHYTVLHLATHALLDEASPLYSHLVLSPSGGNLAGDGRLEAWEIMRMKLSAELVVLAACDTGGGRVARGEGLIGMMWALFASGAQSMVVSQVPVESKSATALMLSFHRRLAGGGSKAAQLRAAAIELLRTPRYAHPYYWAGFILAGDSD